MKKKNKVYSTTIAQSTNVVFENSFRSLTPYFNESNIILIDKNLRPYFTPFLGSKALVFFLEGSEKTKSLKTLNSVLEKIFSSRKFDFSKKTKLVVIGGGTLGDFGGFLSHILKRGLSLVLVPSTWLSAIDSAHGGKNGINFGSLKNQLGTIYPAEKVILVKELLGTQNTERNIEGFGELIKIAYIDSDSFYRKVAKLNVQSLDLFNFLPGAIEGKYKVVRKDPHETKGIRYLLNFGHTIGHVWESALGIHHGISVLLGMYFDFLWAQQRGLPVKRDLGLFADSHIVQKVLLSYYTARLFSLNEAALIKTLSADKKKENKIIRYVFPYKPGRLKIESVTVAEIVNEFRRQKQWLQSTKGRPIVKV